LELVWTSAPPAVCAEEKAVEVPAPLLTAATATVLVDEAPPALTVVTEVCA